MMGRPEGVERPSHDPSDPNSFQTPPSESLSDRPQRTLDWPSQLSDPKTTNTETVLPLTEVNELGLRHRDLVTVARELYRKLDQDERQSGLEGSTAVAGLTFHGLDGSLHDRQAVPAEDGTVSYQVRLAQQGYDLVVKIADLTATLKGSALIGRGLPTTSNPDDLFTWRQQGGTFVIATGEDGTVRRTSFSDDGSILIQVTSRTGTQLTNPSEVPVADEITLQQLLTRLNEAHAEPTQF